MTEYRTFKILQNKEYMWQHTECLSVTEHKTLTMKKKQTASQVWQNTEYLSAADYRRSSFLYGWRSGNVTLGVIYISKLVISF